MANFLAGHAGAKGRSLNVMRQRCNPAGWARLAGLCYDVSAYAMKHNEPYGKETR